MSKTILELIQDDVISSLFDFYRDMEGDIDSDDLVKYFAMLGERIAYIRKIESLPDMITKMQSCEFEDMGIYCVDRVDVDGYLTSIICSND